MSDYFLDDSEYYDLRNYISQRNYKPTFPTKVTLKFKVGDRVRLKNGTAEIEVTRVWVDFSRVSIDGMYVNSENYVTQRSQDDFVLFDGESKMTNTNKLYTWKETYTALDGVAGFKGPDLYGHYLATNSQGEWVMEVKGFGQIVAVAKDKVQEVLPYTISVKFQDSGTVYHYLADKGKFDVGYYLTKAYSHDGWQIAQVTAVDTKSNKATKEFAPIGKLAVDLY